MWLPHCIYASFWISHLALQANADLQGPTSTLWLPYAVGDDFLRDAERYQPNERSRPTHQPEERSRPTRCLNCFSLPSTSVAEQRGPVLIPQVIIDPDEKRLRYFQTTYPRLTVEPDRLALLQQSIAYLVSQGSKSLQLLKSWGKEMVKILEKEPTRAKAETITYGLCTLILKNHRKNHVALVLGRTLDECRQHLERWHTNRFPDLPLWSREMLKPRTGLTKELLSCDSVVTILLKESRLKKLGLAIRDQDFPIVRQELPVISQIFSSRPEHQELSSYTRVAAIALLYHAMHLPVESPEEELLDESTDGSIAVLVQATRRPVASPNESPDPPISQIATDMALKILDQNDFFILVHEKVLLKKVFNDYINDDDPGRQVPIPEFYQATSIAPR